MSQQSDHDLIIEIHTDVKAIKEKQSEFVTEDRFAPVEKIAYGLVITICLTVLGAVLTSTVGAKANENRVVSSSKF